MFFPVGYVEWDLQITSTPAFPRTILPLMPEKRLITREQLMQLAKKARKEADLDQGEVADDLEVSQGAVSQAETNAESSLDELRKRIVRRYLGIEVEGPTPGFRVLDDQNNQI
jgi:predicted XRE-type DNA-binding protein